VSRTARRRSRRRPRRSPAEYFLAALGALILIVTLVVIVTPSSCRGPGESTGVPPVQGG